MANDYYTRSASYTRGTTARGDTLEGSLDSVEAGFDLLPDLTEFSTGLSSYYVEAGSANTYEITSTSISSYSAGLTLNMKIANTNTGASTLEINALGPVALKRTDLTAVQAGDLVLNGIVQVIYNGSVFVVLSSTPGIVAEAATQATAAASSASDASDTATDAATDAATAIAAMTVIADDATTDTAADVVSTAADVVTCTGLVSSVSLPTISGGDAGKRLQVNSGETAYEFYTAALEGEISVTAHGAIAEGDLVVMRNDGKAMTVAEILNSSDIFASVATSFTSVAYDSNLDRVVVAYHDDTASVGKAVVGTVASGRVTWGTPVTFSGTDNAYYIKCVFDSTNNKIVITYHDLGGTTKDYAVVGTVSTGPDSISFGSRSLAISSVTSTAVGNSLCFDSANGKAVYFKVDSGGDIYGFVGTVSGTGITWGSGTVTRVGITTAYPSHCVFDSTNGKVIVAYAENGTAYVQVGTVSGTAISFGTADSVVAAHSANGISLAYDVANNKILFAAKISTSVVKAFSCTVSSTDITIGTGTTVTTDDALLFTLTSANNQFIFTYMASDFYAIPLTISGSDVLFGNSYTYSEALTSLAGIYDPDTDGVVICFKGADTYGATRIMDASAIGGVLSAETFLGISTAAYADGATANIFVSGQGSDNQTGLNPGYTYYANQDNTLTIAAGTPSVPVGLALSATKILIKG